MGEAAVPYWQVNVPVDKRAAECPVYLQNLTQIDEANLGVLDAEHHRLTWPEVQKLIGMALITIEYNALTVLRDQPPGAVPTHALRLTEIP
jgi:hypothetical protein